MKRQFIVLLLAGGILLPSLPVSADGLFSNITNSQNAADEYKQFRNEVEQYRKNIILIALILFLNCKIIQQINLVFLIMKF